MNQMLMNILLKERWSSLNKSSEELSLLSWALTRVTISIPAVLDLGAIGKQRAK